MRIESETFAFGVVTRILKNLETLVEKSHFRKWFERTKRGHPNGEKRRRRKSNESDTLFSDVKIHFSSGCSEFVRKIGSLGDIRTVCVCVL